MKQEISQELLELRGRIVAERRNRGWTQEQLSEKIGIKRSSLNMKEQGLRLFRLEEVIRIANAFELSMEELVRGVKPAHRVTHRDLGLSDACQETMKAFQAANPDSAEYLSKALSSPAVLDLLVRYMEFPMEEENAGGNRFICMTELSEDPGRIRCAMSPGFFEGVLQAALLQALREIKEK